MPKCTDATVEFGRLGRRVIEANRLQAEGQLSAGLGRLFAVAENYPDLKANTSFMQLQGRISALEEQIAFRGWRSQFGWWRAAAALCRYITRPALSEQRLSLTAGGKVRYQLKAPWRNGTTHVVYEPLDFLAKLASLVPRPRVNPTRYHGVFAPNSAQRALVTRAGRSKGRASPACRRTGDLRRKPSRLLVISLCKSFRHSAKQLRERLLFSSVFNQSSVRFWPHPDFGHFTEI
jgi:hypothetical protein